MNQGKVDPINSGKHRHPTKARKRKTTAKTLAKDHNTSALIN